jgi:hypothetical protein
MAHEIENMFTVVKKDSDKPWHNLGVYLNNPPSIDEAIKAAGLDWNVSKMPVHVDLNGTMQTVSSVTSFESSIGWNGLNASEFWTMV